MPAWTCLIRPFHNRLDVEIPFLFYRVPLDNPAGPVTVFTDRFWDDKEHWLPPGVGVVPNSLKPYFGPIPDGSVGTVEGDPNQWIAGFDYNVWIAGGYQGTCWPIAAGIIRAKVRQVQTIGMMNTYSAPLWQKQQLGLFPVIPGSIDQVQTVRGPLARAGIDQVQTVSTPTTPNGTFCANLGATPFARYYMGISGTTNGTCSCGVLNAVWPLAQVTACTWDGSNFAFCGLTGGVHWHIGIAVGNVTTVRLMRATGGPSIIATWSVTGWDGVSPVWLSFVSGVGFCSWPSNVVIVPAF